MGMEFSRTEFVKVLAAGCGAALFPFQAATAAVPSVEEYNVGSGTLIKKNEQPTYQRPAFTAPADSASVLKALEETKGMLNSFGELITLGAWDNIRQDLQSTPVNQRFVKPDQPAVVFAPFLGLGGARAMADRLGVDPARAAAIDKARSDASKVLMELAEFAFTNRVLFFNEEDRRSVARLAAANLEVDLDEARELVSRAEDRVQRMAELLAP